MTSMSLTLIPTRDTALLLPFLRDAEEGDRRIVQAIGNLAMTAYIAQDDKTIVGAVVMHWDTHESEIVYIATSEALRGKGYGKAIMQALIAEARQKGIHALLVGTSNTSWDNIAFYQKCGFRMDSVRKDFFNYLPTPVYENGIRMRDMLILRLSLIDA